MTSTTSSASSSKKTAEMEKILAEIRSHEKSALFAGNTSAHNPDLQMSLDAVQHKMEKCLYKRPRDFVQDMNSVFTVDADSPLASAASSFKLLFQCLLDKYDMVDLGSRQGSSKRHRRGSKRAKAEVFDFVAEFEEELSSGFLFEGEQFLDSDDSSSDDLHLFGKEDDDSSAEDFVPLSFSFEQESVLDGRSPALYSELLGEYGWSEWEDPVSDDPASPKTDAGDSSSPSSPLSTSNNSSTATSPISSPCHQAKRGKRQRSSSLICVSSMRWSKEELLFKITNELPSDKLEGIIMIVNPSLEFGDTDDEDLEFDINALDEATLYRLEDYVYACLADKDDQGNESMMDHHGRGAEIITITQTIEETVTTSPRKRTRTKGQSTSRNPRKSKTSTTTVTSTKNAQAQTLPSPVATKKSTTRTQRRKNASPAKTKSPTTTSRKAATTTKTTQVIETTICHFVEQDEDFNYIPHSRGARLNTLVPEAFEVFRTEQVIKVQKSMSDSDMEEEVDII
jgi:hypothetical protein